MTPTHHYDPMGDELYTLVLSPHYYWCKKSPRAFKSRTQAKKFASSVFDLPDCFEYDVYAQGDELFFVAFDKQQIKERLIDQGIDLSKVEKIYLSQAFFNAFETPVAISEHEALARIHGVVVAVKRSLCTEIDDKRELFTFAADTLIPLKIQGLGSKTTGSLQRALIALAAMAAVWLMTTFINLQMTHHELIAKQEALKADYHLPQTSFQLKSIVKRLEKIDKTQHFMRELLHTLTQNKTLFASSVKKIRLDAKGMECQVARALDKQAQSQLQKELKKYAKSVSFSLVGGQSLVKVVR